MALGDLRSALMLLAFLLCAGTAIQQAVDAAQSGDTVQVAAGKRFAKGTNVCADPLFVNPSAFDFHLKSQFGRWDPKAKEGKGDWVKDDVSSPGLDAGARASDFSKETAPNGGRINLGVYGGTPEASKSAK